MTRLDGVKWQWALVVWTLFVWLQRVVNIATDDDLTTGQRVTSGLVAVFFVALAVLVARCLLRRDRSCQPIVDVLAIAGVLRWTIRAPVVLLSDVWSTGFKVVHTVLWLGTIFFSWQATREVRKSSAGPLGAAESAS